MKVLWRLLSYITYKLRSKTRFKVHSPFVYELVEKVFRDNTKYDDFDLLNDVHARYKKRTDKVETLDFGANSGSRKFVVKYKSVGKLVKKSGHTKKQLELLFRLARYFKPDQILELGTSVGISTAYLGKGWPKAKLVTMEGSMGIASVADDNLKRRGVEVELEVGEFSAIIDHVLENIEKLDLVFFDGNHRMEATLNYFEKCVAKSHEESVFIFDDIHWSPGMELAWRKIQKDQRVSISVDIYWAGIVFFRKGIEKQNFVIRY